MTYNKPLMAVIAGLACLSTSAYAIPFSVVANGDLPISIPAGGVAAASYTITNRTSINPPMNYIRYLPPNVQVNPLGSTCSPASGFKLAPGQSCVLNLNITGPVYKNDTNIHNHLYVCMSDSVTCAGPDPANSINVTVANNINNPVLFGIADSGIELTQSTDSLFRIDTKTAKLSLVMTFNDVVNPSLRIFNAQVIASDGNSLYRWSGFPSGLKKGGVNQIFEQINLATLTTTPVPLTGQSLGPAFGAVFYRSANAFLVTSNAIAIDPGSFNSVSTGGYSKLIGSSSLNYITGMACYNHLVYGATSNNVFAQPPSGVDVVQLNPANGAILTQTPIAMSGYTVQGIQGLTVNPATGVFYALLSASNPQVKKGIASQKLVTLNVNTGVATLVGEISGLNMTSIAFNPADSSC